MTKSLITNLIFVLLIGVSFVVPDAYHNAILFFGLFGFSGAITNQVAIHMLFEKVPFLYGSGVIEENFDTFKISIKNMIMEQFFTQEQLKIFFSDKDQNIDLSPLVEKADFSSAFDALSLTVMESKFGAAISMFGGEDALETLRDPFSRKLKSAVSSIVSSDIFKEQLAHHVENSVLSKEMVDSVEDLITKRLNDLTPPMIKELVHSLIGEHLSWLVVWGGVFGGVIGLVSSLFI